MEYRITILRDLDLEAHRPHAYLNRFNRFERDAREYTESGDRFSLLNLLYEYYLDLLLTNYPAAGSPTRRSRFYFEEIIWKSYFRLII